MDYEKDIRDSNLMNFRPSRAGGGSLYIQIYQRFREAIVNGNLPANARVPSIRTLASELQVSRNTIEKAYDLLIGEGLLISNGAAGTTVSYSAIRHLSSASPDAGDFKSSAGQIDNAVKHTESQKSTDLVCESGPEYLTEKLTTEVPLPFQLGMPALDAFPLGSWLTISRRVLRERNTFSQVEGAQGYYPLRQAIAAYLQVSRGISCSAAQVFITQGYRQSLALVVSAILQRDQEVWVEDPVYPIALRFLKRQNLNIVPIPVDQEGISVTAGLARSPKAKLALLTPANQSPLGTVMSIKRRHELLAWAAGSGAVLLEDDYDSEFCEAGRLQPTLCSLDRNCCTIYLGTFSKALHPTMRISYIVVPSTLIAEFSEASYDVIDGSPTLNQRILADFMVEGHFGRHLKVMRVLYAQRRKLFLDVLKSTLSQHVYVPSRVDSGLSVLARLRGSRSDRVLAEEAKRSGLSVGALSERGIEQYPGEGLLLGYVNFGDRAAVESALKKLADCFK